MTRGVLAILGSGETAPGMTKVHRGLLSRYPSPDVVNLNSAYGFQENLVQMSEKLTDYFRVSLHVDLETLHLPTYDEASPLQRADVKRRVREADYVFAGPGSPSYALAQWRPLSLTDDLEKVLERGGTMCFSSAAALTLGAFTAPVYEIYKVGTKPHWLEGLNVMALAGLDCVVIPHFDNAEGGNHDTSRCYLGERRLERMRAELPEGIATLGVDEHTALIIDLDQETFRVEGRGSAYWITDSTLVLTNGETQYLAELKSSAREASSTRPSTNELSPSAVDDSSPRGLGERLATVAPNELALISQLVTLAERGRDDLIEPGPLVESVLEARRAARDAKQFDLADRLRDALVDTGVEVNDGPSGTTWSLRSSN